LSEIIKPTDESALHKIKDIDVKKYIDAFTEYRTAREAYDMKIIENENWFRQQYWQYLIDKTEGNEPTSGTLLNAILNKHADLMDNQPAPVFLAREKNDEEEAERLTKVVPVIMQNANWDDVYDKYCMYKIKQGIGCLSVTWDDTLENGLGDIVINYLDILRIYWEPNCTNLQDSRYVFVTSLIDTDILKEQYPDKLTESAETYGGQDAVQIKTYEGQDQTILANKTLVIDCYERTTAEDGRQIVHLTKIANDVVLESSITNADTAQTGIYAHGRYPFIIDQYISLEGTLEGMGLIDMNKNNQGYVDKLDTLSLNNSIVASKQRWLTKEDGGVNPDDIIDLSKDVIVSSTTVDDSAIRPFQANPLPDIVTKIRQDKIQEMKELSGNRDFNQGGTTGGVTAFGAIAALQEAGNKTTRDLVKSNYRSFKKLVTLVVELIREFYSEDRQFRIIGDDGKPQYITFNNQNMINQITNMDEAYLLDAEGNQIPNPEWEPEYRKPVYDIEIIPQKENPFNTISHNQMMLDLFERGVFNPGAAIPATLLLENMIFDGKEKLLLKVKENGEMYNQMMQMQQEFMQMQQIIQAQQVQIEEQQAHIEQLKRNIDGLVNNPIR
jgi:hypothetical protein